MMAAISCQSDTMSRSIRPFEIWQRLLSFVSVPSGPRWSPWKPELLARHLTIFPEGQLVAVDENGRVSGSASSLIIDWDDYAELAKWSVITGAGTFDTHNPLGKTLYGADIGVDPLAQNKVKPMRARAWICRCPHSPTMSALVPRS